MERQKQDNPKRRMFSFYEVGYTRRAGQGRRRPSTQQQDQYLPLLWEEEQQDHWVLQNDLQQATGEHVSDQTVRNRLHEGGMMSSCGTYAYSPAPCNSIGIHERTPELACLPLRPCSLHRCVQCFTLSTRDRHERIWRCCGERYAAFNIIQYD